MQQQLNIKQKICSFENLYKALRHCKKGVMWKDSVARFSTLGLLNIYYLEKALNEKKYHLSKYFHFKVFEPKERAIVSTRIRDRVFEHSFNVLYFYPLMTKSFIYDNVACQVNKGNEMGRKRLKRHLQHFYRKHGTEGWVLKIDIKNFFGSINYKIAYREICKRIEDKWVREFCKTFLWSFNSKETPGRGLGLGSELTQIIALAMLDPLDHIIKEKWHIKYYIRYMDNLVLIHPNKEYLQQCLDEITKWLICHKLQLNEKKTQIFPLKQGIKFLGFRFKLNEGNNVQITLLPEKISKERRKLRKQKERVNVNLMTKKQNDDSYNCWKSYVGNCHKKGSKNSKVHRNTHNLIKKMDKYVETLWRE